MSLLSVVTASLRFLFLLRQVGLLDRTSFQIWSRWLIGWSESAPEPTDLSVTKQPNTFAESRSRVTAFSRSISCRESGFAPANVVDWESWRVLSAIFCSMTFNCLLLDFRSEMRWPSVEWISYTTKCRQTNCAACSGKTQYVPLQVVTYMNIFLNLKLKLTPCSFLQCPLLVVRQKVDYIFRLLRKYCKSWYGIVGFNVPLVNLGIWRKNTCNFWQYQ